MLKKVAVAVVEIRDIRIPTAIYFLVNINSYDGLAKEDRTLQ
jgi:hypothetical protein